jgi:hypothetical protein
VGDGRARAACADLHYAIERHVAHLAPKRLGESGPVGVVADALALREHDRVDSAKRTGVVGELVEKCNDRLFAGVRDVETVEPRALNAGQEIGQSLDAKPQFREINQPIDVTHALRLPFPHVHFRGARALDVLANEAQKDRGF